MDRQKLLFLYNPHAGRGLIRVQLSDIVDLFVKAGYEVTVYPTQEKGDATQKIPLWADQYDRIICCGGDGTMDEVVAGMLQTQARTPVGYLPAGTTNDFAKSLAVPTDLMEAAAIAANGRQFACDIGTFNDNSFSYIAAFGVFTELSYQTGQRLKSVLGQAAYLLNSPKSLLEMPSFAVEVEVNGETVFDTFSYGMVTNAVSVAGMRNLTGTTVELDDGLFELTLVKTPTGPLMAGDIVTNLLKQGDSYTPNIISYKTDHVRLRCDEPIPWTLDGEFGGDHTDVEIGVLPRRITFIVPDEAL
ncbi:MAG: diacylglycerol kinase family lipid kinase, partial [Coriobacteriaceae bacterium]|nr:diacylglycerol kinase family lipid kinase [Coriobacteriaceae bacterium]